MSHRGTRGGRPDGSGLRPTPFVAIFLALAFSAGSALAQEPLARQGTVEFSLGRYNIAEPIFDTIYETGGSIKGFGLTANLFSYVDFYLDLKMMSRTGLLSHSKEETSFFLLPISFGIRGFYPIAFFVPFGGIGLDYFIYHENNPIGTTLDYAAGWHLLGGFYLQIGKSFPILPFVKIKYTMVKASVGTRTVDLGGFEYGAGLAIAF